MNKELWILACSKIKDALGGGVILAILIAGFFVHFGYGLFYHIPPSVDALRYVETAWNIVSQGVYCLDCNVPLAADRAIHGVGPGYQFFLAGIFALVGRVYWPVWLLQSLLSLGLAIYAAYKTRAQVSWVRTLFIAVLVFHPDIIQSDAMLMTDTLFVALAACVTEALLWLARKKNIVTPQWVYGFLWVLVGGGYALANLIRPTGLPLMFMGVFALVVLRISWRFIILLMLGFALVQSPWIWRNHQVYGRWMMNSAVGNINLWVGLHPAGDGRYDLESMPDVLDANKRLSAADMEAYSAEQVRRLLRERPIQSVARFVQKGFTLFSLTKTSGYWFHYKGDLDRGVTIAFSLIANTLLLLFGLAGFFHGGIQSWKKRLFEPDVVIRGGAVIACVAAPVLTVVAYRYRLPLLPFFTLFSLGYLYKQEKTRTWWASLVVSLSIISIGTLIDILVQWGKIVTRLSAMFL